MTAETLTRKITANWNSASGQNYDSEPAPVAINFKPRPDAAGSLIGDVPTSQERDNVKTIRDADPAEADVLKVLMVEDSCDDCELICYQLKKCGFTFRIQRVFCEETMRAALERDQWDIVFTDHGMPGFTGMQAIALLQKWKLQIPVICITGCMDPRLIRRILAAGARACISKDDLSLLCMTVKRALNPNPKRDPNYSEL